MLSSKPSSNTRNTASAVRMTVLSAGGRGDSDSALARGGTLYMECTDNKRSPVRQATEKKAKSSSPSDVVTNTTKMAIIDDASKIHSGSAFLGCGSPCTRL